MELDADIGKVMDAIRAEAPNTIVIVTADNGAWQDAFPIPGPDSRRDRAPIYQTTVISSDDVAATAALKGSHEQGAPACSS
jgi:arylsulfatase A-like enzyme